VTQSDSRIHGKVAAILSTRELVLNVGSEAGVELGTRFVVLNSKGVDVRDPDTGEIIGTVEVPKTVVKVVRVEGPRLSVARTFRTIPGRAGVLDAISSMASLAGTPERIETLRIEAGTSIRAELSDEESYVKPGDIVVETKGNEYDDVA